MNKTRIRTVNNIHWVLIKRPNGHETIFRCGYFHLDRANDIAQQAKGWSQTVCDVNNIAKGPIAYGPAKPGEDFTLAMTDHPNATYIPGVARIEVS